MLPVITVEANTIAEGWHKAMVEVYNHGLRIETPKHQAGMSLGYDADVTVNIRYPLSEPKIHRWGLYDDDVGLQRYILDVTHGIDNHRVNQDENFWGYTYNLRFEPRIPLVFERIKQDWDTKHRLSGRDYQLSIWNWQADLSLEQNDPPCLQRIHLRIHRIPVASSDDYFALTLITDWRSRDLAKAWLENVIALTKLQEFLASALSDMLGINISMSNYIDRSSSLHIYGKYLDEDRMGDMIKEMSRGYIDRKYGITVQEYLGSPEELRERKQLIWSQMQAELNGLGRNLSYQTLLEKDKLIRYYPMEWDSYPKSWKWKERSRHT